MSILTITDLKDAEALDQAAMQDLHGGRVPTTTQKRSLDRYLKPGTRLSFDFSIGLSDEDPDQGGE
jgi:hypothetical protein